MIRWRRSGTRCACAVALLWTVAGCAPSARLDAGPPTVRVLLPPSERPFWEPIARAFERDHPGVRAELVEGPQSTDLRENLYSASLLARDPTFDLVYMDVTWAAKFAAAGWLRPLDAFASGPGAPRFLDAALEAGRYRDHLVRVPVRTDMGLLFYRRDWLDSAGFAPPRSFDDLTRIARALQSPPRIWGFVWQGKQYEGLVCDFLEILRGEGGAWIDATTLDVGLDAPPAFRALSRMVASIRSDSISPAGVTTYQEEESRRLFQDGRAVFLRNWPYAWRLAQKEDSPLRGRVGVIPMVHGEGGRSAGTLGGWGLGVSAESRHPDLAEEFIRTAISLEGQRLLCAPTGYAPAREEAYRDSALLAANPFLESFHELHEFAVPRPPIAHYALASDILQRHLSAALTGGEAPETALRAAARETRAMLAASPPTRKEVALR